MGVHSGYNGNRGQRVAPPPSLNPHRAPSTLELGISEPPDPNWPLSVKRVTLVNIERVLSTKTRFQEETRHAYKWLQTNEFYGEPYTNETRIPKAKLTGEQLQVTIDYDKVEVHTGRIRGYANVFLVPQPVKKNWRQIGEPSLNRSCQETALPELRYETRRGRRERAKGSRFMGEFDFAAYFDGFEIPTDLRDYFVFMVQDSEVPSPQWGLYHLTRMPMGARHAPGVAQFTTWVILELVSLECTQVVLDSMIDNVRMCEEDPDRFVLAVKSFLKWVKHFNITLNTGDLPDIDIASNRDWLAWGSKHRIFLGELYLTTNDVFTHVCNTEKTVSKVKKALVKLVEHSQGYTKCNFASFVSLICYALHTIGLTPRDYPALLRAHSAVCSTVHKEQGWEEPVEFVHESVITDARSVTDILVANVPSPLKVRIPPSFENEQYEAVGIVDASGCGWASYVNLHGKAYELTEGWQEEDESFAGFSASSEPQAVLRTLAWIFPRISANGRIAIVTDHSAIVWAQNKWESDFGGVGRGWHLNSLYRFQAHRMVDYFYVHGDRNIVDGPSRSVVRGQKLRWIEKSLQFPRLSEFSHPYLARRAIPGYAR